MTAQESILHQRKNDVEVIVAAIGRRTSMRPLTMNSTHIAHSTYRVNDNN